VSDAAAAPTTVLLVEDSPEDADLIVEALADAEALPGANDFAVVHVTRLADALARLTDGGVGVVVLDLSLPDSHGPQTFARVHAAAPSVPIVILSGLADEAVAVRTVREGAQEYLVKGEVDGRLLSRSLRYAIERKRAEVEHARFEHEQAARRHAEAARQRVEELAAERAAILAQIAEGVVVADATGVITFANESARRLHGGVDLTGASLGAAGGVRLLTLDGQPHPPEELPLARALQLGAPVIDAQWRVVRPDGSEVVAQGSATPVRADDGAILGAVLVMRDVTARHNLDREREAFFAAVSHDLKNPLTAVVGSVQRLLRRLNRQGALDPNQLRTTLVGIDGTARRMAAMTDELLDVARVRMGQPLALSVEPVDLVGLARQVAREHQQATERHQIAVEADEPELVGQWDAVRLARVLHNLIGNAVKYSPAGGRIGIRVERADAGGRPTAVLRVDDHGIGIPTADLGRVFDRFHRGSNAAGRIAGSGIGLAGARQIVEQHGGTIEVESREGEGSVFTVRLPLTVPLDLSDGSIKANRNLARA
jgi:PAS domain S-box-containing protein